MRQAGINPSAALAGGTSVTQPFSGSGGSVGQGSMPSLPLVGQAIAPQFPNIVNSVGNFMESLASAKKMGVETRGLENLIPKQIEGLLLQNNGQELLNAQRRLDLDINKLVKDDKVKSYYYQWRNLMFDTFLKGAEADLKHVQTVTEVSKQRLNDALSDLHGSEREKLALDITHYERQFNTYMDNLRSQSNVNNATARKASSEAELTSENVIAQRLANNIKQATNLADIDNAIAETEKVAKQQGLDNLLIFAEVVKAAKTSKLYRESNAARTIDAGIEKLRKSLGIGVNVGISNR